VFSLTRCILLYQQTRKHVQIISCLQLNHDSLLIRYRSNSAKNAICYQTRRSYFFLSSTQRIGQQCMVLAVQFSCCSRKLHFFNSYCPSSPEMNSNDYSTRFMESYGIMNMSCKSATLKKSSSNWLNSGKPLTQHLKGTISAFPCFPR